MDSGKSIKGTKASSKKGNKSLSVASKRPQNRNLKSNQIEKKLNDLKSGSMVGSGVNGRMTLSDYGAKFSDSVDGEVKQRYKRWGKNRRDQHGDIKRNIEEQIYASKSRGTKALSDVMWTKSDDIGVLDRLEGRNAVLEALKSGRPLNKLVIAQGAKEGAIRQIYALAKENGIIIQEVDRSKLNAIVGHAGHQGVIAYLAAAEYVEVADILERAKSKGEDPFVLVLDEITDPQNLGAIIRTAEAAGVHGVIIPKRRAVGLTSVVAKASAGAVSYVPVARATNIARTLAELKNAGLWIIGTDAEGEKTFFDSDMKGPIAIVTGSEGQGMSRLVRENCDFIVSIPMKGKITSLNASAATALMVYEVVRQRG